MSESMLLPTPDEPEQKRLPTVYFIDDSATMREVIKIAFRRENINVVTCGDARSALAQFEQNPPDVVITDVIMPDQDGYSVCSEIKQHPDFGHIPVVLMSGVVNKSVADKAVSVKADELIRKPFQPQELISRVRSLLKPQSAESSEPRKTSTPSVTLNQLFAPAPVAPVERIHSPMASAPVPSPMSPVESAWPRALADAFSPRPNVPPAAPPQAAVPTHAQGLRPASSQTDAHKLRAEITFLDALVKKLQAELQNERQYNQALEAQIRALTQGD
jgi:CheY-like chemotaxis protein